MLVSLFAYIVISLFISFTLSVTSFFNISYEFYRGSVGGLQTEGQCFVETRNTNVL